MVMKRMNRFFKAYVHEGLERLEDPVVMVKQYMREMKEDIEKIEAAIRQHARIDHTLTRDWELAKDLVARREQQAKVAIEAEKDELARMALVSKKEALLQMNRYEQLREKNNASLLERKQELEQLQQKYAQLRDRKLELILRVQAVKANEQIKRTKQKYEQTSGTIENEFERMEERVTDLEWRSGGRIEMEPVNKDLMYSEEIQAELEEMKKQTTVN
ncbi:PspA/IM30 family protein [bacterium LRH843]|nr:PspA/IM30 family protein [bacterium LRH843]